MKSTVEHENYVEAQKKEAEEMIDILKRVPAEKKERVRGIVIGFALAEESKTVRTG